MDPLSPGTLVIVNLLGGVALLLWGVRMVRTGIVRGWGERLKRLIERRLSNRVTALGAGIGATLLLQSGTATALIVTGLAAAGTIEASRALAVLLGADVGSAIVTAVFATGGASVSVWLAPILFFAGYVTFSASSEFKPRNVGRILLGFGLMLMALYLVTSATAPLRGATLFHSVLETVAREPVVAFLVGAFATWLSYSSLAIILIIASFVANGSLGPAEALPFVLGVNFGGGFPALTSTAQFEPAARRAPLANMLCRGIASAILLPFLPRLSPAIAGYVSDPIQKVLVAHVAFNVALALIFLPVSGLVMRVVKRLLPDQRAADDHLIKPRYLDRRALESASVALSNAALETARMTELLDRMFRNAVEALKSDMAEPLKEVRTLDERLNVYQADIQVYVAELSQNELSAEDSRRALEIMLYVSNLEHAGDIVHLNLADRIKAKIKEGVRFTQAESAALDDLIGIVLDSLRLAAGVLGSGDVAGARRLIEQKGFFRALENKIISDQFQAGGLKGRAMRRGALFVDLIRDLHAINSHIVSAGYPIVDAAGLLRQSRLRSGEQPKP